VKNPPIKEMCNFGQSLFYATHSNVCLNKKPSAFTSATVPEHRQSVFIISSSLINKSRPICFWFSVCCILTSVCVCWLQQGHCISLYCRTYSQPYLKLKIVMYRTRTQCYLLRGAGTRVRLYSTCNPIHNRPSLIPIRANSVYSGGVALHWFSEFHSFFGLPQTSVNKKIIKGCV
jgi:hypothetical protein